MQYVQWQSIFATMLINHIAAKACFSINLALTGNASVRVAVVVFGNLLMIKGV